MSKTYRKRNGKKIRDNDNQKYPKNRTYKRLKKELSEESDEEN